MCMQDVAIAGTVVQRITQLPTVNAQRVSIPANPSRIGVMLATDAGTVLALAIPDRSAGNYIPVGPGTDAGGSVIPAPLLARDYPGIVSGELQSIDVANGSDYKLLELLLPGLVDAAVQSMLRGLVS